MRWVTAALAGFLIVSPLAASAASDDTGPVVRAWLALVDKGQYDQSWAAAGSIFKSHVSKARWSSLVGGVRAPLGQVMSRKFTGDQRSNSLPGVPDGHYDVVRFSTVFAHKATAAEIVVMALDAGEWRVIGYFIH